MSTDIDVTDSTAGSAGDVYIVAGIDQNTGNVIVGLNGPAAAALRLIAEDVAGRWDDIMSGSDGWSQDVAADIANTASLLNSHLSRIRAGGY
jgi:hypothetical protein